MTKAPLVVSIQEIQFHKQYKENESLTIGLIKPTFCAGFFFHVAHSLHHQILFSIPNTNLQWILIVILLPQPLGPIINKISPLSTCKFTEFLLYTPATIHKVLYF